MAAAAVMAVSPLAAIRSVSAASAPKFRISVAAWSLHKEIYAGEIKSIDCFRIVREEFGIDGFELVNNLLEVPTAAYVNRMRKQSEKFEVEIPLIMIDSEGPLGGHKAEDRKRAVRDHAKWIPIASDLGCHSIRVNWGGAPRNVQNDAKKTAELIARSTPSYKELASLGRANGINIIIENHWGPSSYPDVLVKLIEAVDEPNFGTLPDFGNFPDDVDRYDAVDKMMPFAKAVSAKCYDFDEEGYETKIDFARMLEICVGKHGYDGFIGIEYEGKRLSEREGIKAGRDLLRRYQ